METMNANDVKKELYKSKANARLLRVENGVIYYGVPLEDGLYEFPIRMVEELNSTFYKLDAKTQTSPNVGLTYLKVEETLHQVSPDVKTTFCLEMKASDLNRWIGKAIERGEFAKIS